MPTPRLRRNIFKGFARGTPRTAGGPPGIGLGLAFVAELAVLQHGSVQVQDRPAGGARFTVELPLVVP